MRFLWMIPLVLLTPSVCVAETAYLRAPGDLSARVTVEVGLWKTEAAAKKGPMSLSSVLGTKKAKELACYVAPGTRAKVLSKKGSIVYVQEQSALFGCKGYVRSEFLSPN